MKQKPSACAIRYVAGEQEDMSSLQETFFDNLSGFVQ